VFDSQENDMRVIAIAAAAAFLSIASAHGQGMSPASPADSHVCLRSTDVDHTTTVNSSTLLFHMKNGVVWKNTLKSPCPGLNFHGFEYLTRADEICSDAQSIRVLEGQEVCVLGPFTPYTPPQHSASATP
jgi:hypothetical protein